MISNSQWDVYKKIINDAHDYFNQEEITWFRKSYGLQRYGEDDPSNITLDEITLKCLNGYNYFRSWPMTDETVAGKLDQESMVVLLNNEYLREQGYLNENGNFDFDPGTDYFVFQGQRMESSGETPMSQAGDEPLFTMLILKRDITRTGEDKY